MGYSYEDFVKAASGAGLLEKFSPDDIETTRKNPEYGLSMLGFMRDAQKATTAEQRSLAEAAAEQLRSSYKVASGSGSVPAFSYDNESKYQELLNKVSNPTEFRYDAETDDGYKAARAAYLREGQRASANALTQASAATGGVPSSYAVTAATQAGNYYAGQAADLLPTFEQTAYQRYLNGINADQTALSAVEGDRATKYSAYLNQLNLQRQQEQDALAAKQQAYQNALAAEQLRREQEQQDYQRQQATEQLQREQQQQAYNNALAMYQLLGYATPEIAATLGIPEGVTPALAGRTSGGNDTGGTVDNGTLTGEEVLAMQNWLNSQGAGIVADGAWGAQSQGAAQRLGFDSIDAAWAAYQEAQGQPAGGGISAEDLAMLERNSNNGVVTNQYLWNELLRSYTVNQLREAGYTFGQKKGNYTGGNGKVNLQVNTQARM